MKKRYLLAAIAAMTMLAGCGDDSSKDTKEQTTQETADNKEAEDGDEMEALDEDSSQDEVEDMTNEDGEVIDAEEEDVQLDPITPSDYLVKNVDDYVKLGDYDGIEVTKYTYEITDDMVQEEIQEELTDAGEEASTDAPSEDGDTVYLNLTSKVEGEDEDSEPEETLVTLGQEEYGADFDKELTGVSTGDTNEFSITFGDDIWEESWIGKKVDFTAEVTDVTRTDIPEYTDDYVKENCGYDSKEEYEAAVKEYLESSYEDQSYYDEIEAMMTECLNRTEFSGYPDDLFESCKEEAMSTYSMFAGEDGDISDVLDMFGITEDDIKSEAENLVNRRLFISAYAQANDITVTEEEYMDYVKETADYYGENAADFEEMYTRATIVNALYEDKVTAKILESAKVTETPYTGEDAEDDLSEDDTVETELDDMEIVEEGEEGIAE